MLKTDVFLGHPFGFITLERNGKVKTFFFSFFSFFFFFLLFLFFLFFFFSYSLSTIYQISIMHLGLSICCAYIYQWNECTYQKCVLDRLSVRRTEIERWSETKTEKDRKAIRIKHRKKVKKTFIFGKKQIRISLTTRVRSFEFYQISSLHYKCTGLKVVIG